MVGPIYGQEVGLAASQIGYFLAAFVAELWPGEKAQGLHRDRWASVADGVFDAANIEYGISTIWALDDWTRPGVGVTVLFPGSHKWDAETALAYRDFRRGLAETGGPDAPYEFVTSFFVNMNDPYIRIGSLEMLCYADSFNLCTGLLFLSHTHFHFSTFHVTHTWGSLQYK